MAATTASSGESKAHQQDETLFSRLPPELRNYIYELAIVTTSPRPLLKGRYDEALQPGLTCTNKAIRYESLPIFYSNHSFVIGVLIPTESQNALRWFKTIGEVNRENVMAVLVLSGELDCHYGSLSSSRLLVRALQQVKTAPAGMGVIEGLQYKEVKKQCLLHCPRDLCPDALGP